MPPVALIALTCLLWSPCLAQPPEKQPNQRELLQQLMNESRPRHPALPGEPAADSDNAALRYLWLFKQLDVELVKLVVVLDSSKSEFEVGEASDGITTAMIHDSLAAHQDWIEAVIKATQLKECRFGWSPNIRAVLDTGDPRKAILTSTRRTRDVLLADARRLVADNKPDDAARRLAAAINLSRQIIEEPGPLINQLVGENLLRSSSEIAATLAPKLTNNGRAEVLTSLSRLNKSDPSGLRRAWERYRTQAIAFVDQELSRNTVGPELQKELAESVAIRGAVEGLFDNLLKGGGLKPTPQKQRELFQQGVELALKGHDVEELKKLASRAKELGDSLSQRWANADADDDFKKASGEIDADESCLLSIALGFPKLFRRDAKQTSDQVSQAIAACGKN